jgi:hypothetical protein
VADHPDIPALVARLEHYARERKKLRSLDTDAIHTLHSPPDPRHAELTLTDVEAAAAALSRLTRALGERDAEIAEAREACPAVRMQDHADAPLLALVNLEVSRGFNRDAEVHRLAAEASKLRDWRATVTAALGREGGAHYEDVPKHIREMRRALDGIPGHTCHVSSDTCGGCEYAMERDHRLMDAIHERDDAFRERDEARAALARYEADDRRIRRERP